MVAEVLDEIGSPWSRSTPNPSPTKWCRPPTSLSHGCEDAWQIYSGRSLHGLAVCHAIGQPLEDVRHIRDDIAARLKAVCHEMDVTLA
jgi:hypothetical protein